MGWKPICFSGWVVHEMEYGWGEEDYAADKDTATTLLEEVERRIKSLGRHLAKEKKSKEASYEAANS